MLLAAVLTLGAAGASAATVRFHQRSDLDAAQPLGPATNAVIFVLDGASPSDLASAPTPNVLSLERSGVTYRNAWVGQLEDVGPASNATIATGAFPVHHGIVGTVWRNPRSGTVERPADPAQVQLGALDQAMEAHNTTPLAALVKDHFRGAKVLSAGGVGCADADAAGSWLADYVVCPRRVGTRWGPGSVTGHAAPHIARAARGLAWPVATKRSAPGEAGWALGQQDHWVTRYALDVMRREKPVLTVINYPELARVKQELSGSASARATRSIVAGIDLDIGRVIGELKRERLLNRTVFVLTSDQAVSPLTQRTPTSAVGRAVVAAGGGIQYVEPGGTTLVGLQDALQGQPVTQSLHDEHIRGVDALYYKSRLGEGWSYTPQYLDPDLLPAFGRTLKYELSTFAGPTSADVVAIGSPQSGIVSGMRRGHAPQASGLGAQWSTQHIPLIISGHGVFAGVTSDFPARLVDVAPTVASLLGLSSPGGDGNTLADAIREAADNEKSRQQDAATQLQIYVAALRAREQQVAQ